MASAARRKATTIPEGVALPRPDDRNIPALQLYDASPSEDAAKRGTAAGTASSLAECVARFHATDEAYSDTLRQAEAMTDAAEAEATAALNALRLALASCGNSEGMAIVGGNLYRCRSTEHDLIIVPMAEVPNLDAVAVEAPEPSMAS